MTESAVSVVVISRERPEHLRRCLTSLSFQTYRNFEVVVVADDAGLAALSGHTPAKNARLVRNNTVGVGGARNLGLEQACGDVVAFLDDDAVAEPTWLAGLAEPFRDPSVVAATGTVIGRNGISPQWSMRGVDTFGRQPHSAEQAVMLEGTNMAIRRRALCELGGFDSHFVFGFDDTDLSMRLFVSELRVVFAPKALVHHCTAASYRRGRDKRPLNVAEFGASAANFFALHAGSQAEKALDAFKNRQHRWLQGLLVKGSLEPRDLLRLEGELLRLEVPEIDKKPRRIAAFGEKTASFQLFPVARDENPSPVFLSCRPGAFAQTNQKAEELAGKGHAVSLICLSYTTRPHRHTMSDAGVWIQKGGIYGKSIRTQPRFQLCAFDTRVEKELTRIATTKGFDETSDKSPIVFQRISDAA